VDCVRDAARAAHPTRTVVGAPVRSATPYVTFTLIGLNVVSFLLQLALGSRNNPWTNALIFAPSVGQDEPWRFLTAAFLHDTGSIFHIGMNMYALWIVGQALEPVLGRARYVALYLVSAIGSSVMVLLLASPAGSDWYRGVLGASGAVFGLFGAVLVIQHRLHRDVRGLVVLLVINGVIGFVVPRISWQGHLGGFLVGAALGVAFAYAPKAWRRAVAFGAPAAMLLALVALAIVTYTAA
jgi:membrane associated rhomboid family serine protease